MEKNEAEKTAIVALSKTKPTLTVVTTARETLTGQILNTWLAAKDAIKYSEAIIDKLKPRMQMLLPVEAEARAFAGTQNKNGKEVAGRIVLRRVKQDRRKPDPVKLSALLIEKFDGQEIPADAFVRVPNEAFIADLCERGVITQNELEACLDGKQISYVQATFSVDPADLELPEE